MRYAHKIIITAFVTPEDDLDEVIEGIKALLPFDIEKEKISIKQENAEGFNDKQIKIITVILTKENHTNKFLSSLKQKMSTEQRKLLIAQKASRTDANLQFFIRLEKDKWNKDREIFLTDRGKCIHIKISMAAFPAKIDAALKLAEEMLA